MNRVDARSVTAVAGFHGEFRKVHKAGWEKVCENGIPLIFETAEAAEIAAWRALRSHLCGEIVGTGARASMARSKAEEMFGAIIRRGRKIPVEHK